MKRNFSLKLCTWGRQHFAPLPPPRVRKLSRPLGAVFVYRMYHFGISPVKISHASCLRLCGVVFCFLVCFFFHLNFRDKKYPNTYSSISWATFWNLTHTNRCYIFKSVSWRLKLTLGYSLFLFFVCLVTYQSSPMPSNCPDGKYFIQLWMKDEDSLPAGLKFGYTTFIILSLFPLRLLNLGQFYNITQNLGSSFAKMIASRLKMGLS